MDRGLAVLLTAVVGGMVAVQAPINAGLARSTGSFPAALISFFAGTLLLAAIVAASGHAAQVGAVSEVRWYYLLGGALGVAYVTAALVTVNSIGAGGVAAATITGQLVTALALDRLGAFGLEQTALTWDRLLGVAMLLAGTYLVVR